MTNSKTIFGLLAVVFAISMIAITPVLADSIPGYLVIKNSKIEIEDDEMEAKIITKGKIPKSGDGGAFGYGILASGTDNVLAITTHQCASDSPVQGPAGIEVCPMTVSLPIAPPFDQHNDATFHAHILDLMAASSGCSALGAPLEVDVASTIGTGNNVSPDYDLKVKGNHIGVDASIGPSDVNPDGSPVGVVAFKIAPIVSGTDITNLCVIPQ